jgi:hypothetical protein
MKYMLLIYSSEDAWTKDEWNACVAESLGICKELSEKGQLISASPLHPVASGSTVRVRDGKQSITTGPFAETTEQLGGFLSKLKILIWPSRSHVDFRQQRKER